MRIRWKFVLPLLGLSLFAVITYESWHRRQENGLSHSRYFWWSYIRLDSDPLNTNPPAPVASPCKDVQEVCVAWDPISITPGWPVKLLVLTAFPAFFIEVVLVTGLGRFGISQVTTFMISMPLLIFAWYYLIGWLLDRRKDKRRLLKSKSGNLSSD